MKIKINLKHLLIAASVILMTACGSGNSGGGGSRSVNQIAVPSSTQVRTPVSANTNLGTNAPTTLSSMKHFLNSLGDSSCIQLVTQPNGQNYTTTVNSNQWWSTAVVTVGLTNTCSTAQAFTANIIFNNATMNGSALPGSGWTVQQSGSPYMSISGTGGANTQLTVSTPACSGDYCGWAQLAPGATITVMTNLGYSGAINSLNIGSVSLNGSTPAPAPQTTGTLNLNLSATTQTTQACTNAAANCNFQVSVISPSGVAVESATINANQTGSSNYQFTNLLPGQYTIQVVSSSIPSLSAGVITPTYTPSSTVSVGAGAASTSNVGFSYTANAPAPTPTPKPAPTVNSITVHLNTLGLPVLFKNNTVLGRIIDSNNHQVATLSFQMGSETQTISSTSFVTGNQYTVQVQGLGDPQSGIYYDPVQTQFTVVSGNTSVTTSGYQLVTSNLYTVTINVATPVAGQMLSYGADPAADTNSTSYVSFVQDPLVSGQTYTFPAQLVTTITPSTVAGYSTAMTPNNTFTSASAGNTYVITNTALPASLTYQVYYASNTSTASGIGNSYSLIITNNSSQTLQLSQMLFTLRSDAAMTDVITNAEAPNGGTLAGYTKGQCYGVNNGVCDVNYKFNLGWGNATSLAPGATITITGFPNGNSQTQGGSTSGGLPLYLDVAHNVILVDTSGNTYTAVPYTIYPNLQNPNPNKMLGGYFTDWTNYSTPSGRMFPVESAGLNSFPVKNTNTMVYDLMYINGGSQSNGVVSGTVAGDVALADNWADPTYVEEFSYMRAAHPWMDMAISFGGWGSGNPLVGYPSENLQLIFQAYYNNGGTANQAIINNTAQNMINTALLFGFNGVDIDFEQGMCSHPGQVSWCNTNSNIVWNTASRAGYEALLTALYNYSQQIITSGPLNGTKFNISTALPAGLDTINDYLSLGASNFDKVLNNVTYGNIMAYDYHGQWDAGGTSPLGVSDANAPLYSSATTGYGPNHSYTTSVEQYYDIYDTLFCGSSLKSSCPYVPASGGSSVNGYGYFGFSSSALSATQIANKLNLGIPTYTRVENLNVSASGVNSAIYQTLAGSQTWQPSIGGAVSYRCIYNSGGTGTGGYCAPGKQDILPSAVTLSDITPNSGLGPTSPAQTPWFYLSTGSYFGTYDDKSSAQNKIYQINQALLPLTSAQLNGAFVWEIDEDIPVQDSQYAAVGLMPGICQGFPTSTCPTTY